MRYLVKVLRYNVDMERPYWLEYGCFSLRGDKKGSAARKTYELKRAMEDAGEIVMVQFRDNFRRLF